MKVKNLTPIGNPITASVTYRRYNDGKIYAVWKDKSGKVHKRIAGHRNFTDKSVSYDRTPGYVNMTDRKPGRGRTSHKRN